MHLALLAAASAGVDPRPSAPFFPVLNARLVAAPEPPAPEDEDTVTPPAAAPAVPAAAQSRAPSAAVEYGPTSAPEQVAVATRYYAAHELDVYPRLAVPLALESWRFGEFRAVRLELSIDAGGAVAEVRLAGASRDADAAAVRRLMQSARFEPALRAGQAVASRIEIEIAYERAVPR